MSFDGHVATVLLESDELRIPREADQTYWLLADVLEANLYRRLGFPRRPGQPSQPGCRAAARAEAFAILEACRRSGISLSLEVGNE